MINIVFHPWREILELNFSLSISLTSVGCSVSFAGAHAGKYIQSMRFLFKTRRFLWHPTGFRSANHIGGLMLVPGYPLIYMWKFIKIDKNASHMWLVLESGLDLTMASLVIWSVGWIMPLHQIQSTPDMRHTAVKREEKSTREKKSNGKDKRTRIRVREIILIILKQDKRSASISSGLVIKIITEYSEEMEWEYSMLWNGKLAHSMNQCHGRYLSFKHVWSKSENVIVSAVLLRNAEMHRKTPVIIEKHHTKSIQQLTTGMKITGVSHASAELWVLRVSCF